MVQGSISVIFSKVFSQISLKKSSILKTLWVHFSYILPTEDSFHISRYTITSISEREELEKNCPELLQFP